jgi:hypothetical protein
VGVRREERERGGEKGKAGEAKNGSCARRSSSTKKGTGKVFVQVLGVYVKGQNTNKMNDKQLKPKTS